MQYKYIWMKWFLYAVAVDADGSPVTVSLSGDTRRNIIVWMDHRAVKQAEKINSSSSPVLQYCGGSLSPEMQPPKVLRQLVCLANVFKSYQFYCISLDFIWVGEEKKMPKIT